MTERTKSTPIIIVCARCKRERKHHGKGMCQSCYKYLWILNKYKDAPLVKCICRLECEVMIRAWDRWGKPRKFASGHNAYLRTGKNNPSYKGEFREIKKGYNSILFRDHPFNIKGYVRFHRIVYEMYHKCCLLPWTDIHHIDGNKKRNHPENLQALLHGAHSSLTGKSRKYKRKRIRRKCFDCGSKTTEKSKEGYPYWYRVKEIKQLRYRCRKCNRATPEIREYNKSKVREFRRKKKKLTLSGTTHL
jgi:hypothetical protein